MITVVLPTWNRRRVLERTLPVYRALADRHRLLVIDDGSDDGTAPWLRGLGLEVVSHPRRLGLPAARNTALRLATTPWVFFGEDDVLAAADHPQKLLTWSQRLPKAAAVAGALHAGESWDLPERRPPPTPGPILVPGRISGDFAAIRNNPLLLPSLHACALIDRQAALAVGGYDPAYGDSAFREESDFYARLWRSGRSCWLVADPWAIHVRHRLGGGARGGRALTQRLRNRWSYLANDLRFISRHRRCWLRWQPDLPGPGRLKVDVIRHLAGNLLDQVRR